MTQAEATRLFHQIDRPDTDWAAKGICALAGNTWGVQVADRFPDQWGAHREYLLTTPRQWAAHYQSLADHPAVRSALALWDDSDAPKGPTL